MVCWLRYQRGAADPVAFRFDAVSLIQRDDVELENGRTLRRMNYSHKLSERFIYEVTVGADFLGMVVIVPDLGPIRANYGLMRKFWTATRRWISLSASMTTPPVEEFIEVTIDGGTSPEEFIEGNKHLPSYSLTLTEKHPRFDT